MHRAGVRPDARGQGLQRRLIRARVAYAKREGFPEVWTYTSNYNVASSNNLIREGFTLWAPGSWGGSSTPMRPSGGYAWLYWRLIVAQGS